jgi:NAD-dependent deacetylase
MDDSGDPTANRLAAFARDLAAADVAVALTGAGVSTASGVPDFRGEDGVWDRFDPGAFRIDRFRRSPGEFWTDWLRLHDDLVDGDPEPNAAHRALADLETAGQLDAVVTQNVDGLHRAAGSERVVHLHGAGDLAVCPVCGEETPTDATAERVRGGEVPPTCGDCGEPLKPDTVLFGERLPLDALQEAKSLLREADAVLVAGSSLEVDPAGSLPAEAGDAAVAIVNLQETPMDHRAHYLFREDVTEVLPAIRDAVLE